MVGSLSDIALKKGAALDMEPDLDRLQRKAEQVEKLVVPTVADRGSWFRAIEDSVLDLSNAMPAGIEDYDVRKLLDLTVDLRRAVEVDRDADDSQGHVELATLRVGDVVRRIRRRLLREHLDNPRAASDFVFQSLRELGISEIATMLGVSTKTVGAWRRGGAIKHNVGRLTLVAQLLSYLRYSMTARGMMMWFEAPRNQLGGRTPLQLLAGEDPSTHARLIGLARGSRSQLAD